MKSYTQSQPREPLWPCHQNGYGLVEYIIGIVKRLSWTQQQGVQWINIKSIQISNQIKALKNWSNQISNQIKVSKNLSNQISNQITLIEFLSNQISSQIMWSKLLSNQIMVKSNHARFWSNHQIKSSNQAAWTPLVCSSEGDQGDGDQGDGNQGDDHAFFDCIPFFLNVYTRSSEWRKNKVNNKV